MVNPKKLREDRPRIRNPRVARGATHARVRHNARARYATIWQFTLVLCIALVLLPLQAWKDPEGSRRLRLPHFKIIGT